jgi:hypothetical protein
LTLESCCNSVVTELMSCLSSVLENLKDLNILADSFLV